MSNRPDGALAEWGMRDWFAGLAMQSLLSLYTQRSMAERRAPPAHDGLAAIAYGMADAMIKARKGGDPCGSA